MFNEQRLKELEVEQEMLVLQSDLHRHSLRLQIAATRERLAWKNPVAGLLSRSNPWLLGGSALALGLLSFRFKAGLLRWVPATLTVWRMVKPFIRG